jgi:uncharacterized protein
LYLPEGEGIFPAVVVCHPHPLYGGSMDNNVVDSLCEALAAKSMAALKFNFQGVGESQGNFTVEKERLNDVKAALSFIASQDKIDSARLGLAGYSAGAAWGLAASFQDSRVKALCAVSPPFPLFDFYFLLDCSKPVLLVSGSQDQHIPREDFLDFSKKLIAPAEYQIVEGADHFWQGYEDSLSREVALFFSRVLE